MIILFVVVPLFSKFLLLVLAAALGSHAFGAHTIHVQRGMGYGETLAMGILNHTTQLLVAHLGDTATCHTDTMKVSSHVERLLILRTIVKLVADNQMGVGKQLHGVVKRSAAHVELAGIHHVHQLLHRKVSLYGIDGIKDGKTLLRLAQTFVLQILFKGSTNGFFDAIVHITRKVASKGK